MKTKYWVAVGVGMVIAFALFAGNAQAADDDTKYRFRLVNNMNKATYIRCGSSGAWTIVVVGDSRDKSCSQSTAQTKVEGGAAFNLTHNCSPSKPVRRARYYGYWVGLSYKSGLVVGCKAS